jgi:hypothetical protein
LGPLEIILNQPVGPGCRGPLIQQAYQVPGNAKKGGHIPARAVPQRTGEKSKIGPIYETVNIDQIKGMKISHALF